MSENYSRIYLYKRLVQAKLFIDAHFSEPIDLENISDEAFFSKFHFIRLFKTVYGSTPHQYLTKVRIKNAKLFLEQGIPIKDVCYMVGFDSTGSFSTLFKRLACVAPSEYQQTHRKRQELIGQAPLKFIPNCFAEQKGWLEKSNFKEVR